MYACMFHYYQRNSYGITMLYKREITKKHLVSISASKVLRYSVSSKTIV